MTVIEWPPGSGRRADYSEDELELVRALTAQCEAKAITPAELTQQVDVIHDLKVELGASLLPDDPVTSDDISDSVPTLDSPFKIPGSVPGQRQLDLGEDKLRLASPPADGFTDQMTLAEARELLRAMVDEGAECPCCQRFAKVYKRKLNAGMAVSAIKLYRVGAATEYVELSKLMGYGNEVTRLHNWGLVEPMPGRRDDGGQPGWWKLTALGVEFVLCRTRVPSHAVIYAARCLNLRGELVSIIDCLGEKFDYQELMAA